MIYPKIPLAQSVIAIFKAKGLQHIVISPGSRNAPLTIGFASNDAFTCYSIADERCAAFFALGLAQQLQKPVAVLCTSGSALLNYYPAVAEAFYSQIPLVVLSADRPHDKIDIGDGQTIRQENVFANHSLYNANLTEEASEENDLKIQEALFLATAQKGPIHINIPFEEPLYETVEELSVKPELVHLETENLADVEVSEYQKNWNTAVKKLILIGGNYPDAISQEILNTLGTSDSVVVMTEVTSNAHHLNFISHIDTLITPFSTEDFEAFQPDLLITVGGMIVSKRIKTFLRNYKPKNHWHVDLLRAYDTFGCLTAHVRMSPNIFFSEILSNQNSIDSNYQNQTLKIRDYRQLKHQEFLQNASFSDLKVFEKLALHLPSNIQLQISNSSAIRYAQLFSWDASVEVYCNRGTSGIDGSTSTAIGASVGNSKSTVFITGDISFFYDSNALWNNYRPKDFKIILINNGGGGIFRILPGHQENTTFTTFFETSHNLNASHLASMYGLAYTACDSLERLEEALVSFFESDSGGLLEVNTPEKENNKILADYFKFLK